MKYLIAAIFAMAGVGLGAINVWNNAMAINGGVWILNDLSLLVAGLAIASALLSAGAGAVFSRSSLVGALCVLAVIGCTLTSVGYTLGRVGQMQDARTSAAQHHNDRIDAAKLTIAQADTTIGEQQPIAALECRGYNPPSNADRRTAYDQRWPKCLTARGLIAVAEATRLEAAALLDRLGGRQTVDPAGERVEAVTAGLWSADHYRTAHPVITAVTLELCVALLLTAAGLIWSPARVRETRVEIITPEPVDPIVRALQVAGGRVGSNNELAEMLRLPAPRVTERVRLLESAGVVKTYRDGKLKVIELA